MVTNSSMSEAPAAGTPAGPESQPTAPDQTPKAGAEKSEPGAKAQAAKPASVNTPENAEKLRLILKREKEDPNFHFESEKENDLYDAWMEGKLKPGKRETAPKAPAAKSIDENPISDTKPDKAEDLDAGELDKEESETEAEGDDGAEDIDEDEAGKPDPVLESLMKEVGAKTPEEILAKVKGLRQTLGGKDAQEVAKLSRQVQSEKDLWADVAKGVPAAIEHAERVYGIKVARPGAAQTPAQGNQNPAKSPSEGGRGYVSEEAFIEPESAKMVNDLFRQRDAEIDELRTHIKSFNEEREKNQRETALQQSRHSVVDEMVTIAQRMDALKGIGNLREAIATWYEQGKPDARLEVFNEIFDIAMQESDPRGKPISLQAAFAIKRGRESERLVAEAEERGRKAAYGHKPNPSLSGQQGGRNEQGNYSPLTNEQIEAMSEDHTLMPADWFDANDNPVKARIPRKAWAMLGIV